jgi:hypothetical protein
MCYELDIDKDELIEKAKECGISYNENILHSSSKDALNKLINEFLEPRLVLRLLENPKFMFKKAERMNEKLTLNKGNWSGETMSIEINRVSGKFKFDESDMWLEYIDDDMVKLWGSSWPDYPLAFGFLHHNTWMCHADGSGVERDDPDPYVAMIQILCNII